MKKLVFAAVLNFILTGSVWAAAATARLEPTEEGSPTHGEVKLEETAEGLKVSVQVNGVPPGNHGFHIHENGSCAEKGNAAGSHYNPDKTTHGLVTDAGMAHAHPGDLGNIQVAEDGSGKLEATVPGLSLSEGKYNVSGKAMILHEKMDDFGQPTGNAGGRIACGVIEAGN